MRKIAGTLTPPFFQIVDVLIGVFLVWLGWLGMQPDSGNRRLFAIAIVVKGLIIAAGTAYILSGMKWMRSILLIPSADKITIEYRLFHLIPIKRVFASRVELAVERHPRPFSGTFESVRTRFKNNEGCTAAEFSCTRAEAIALIDLCKSSGIGTDGGYQLEAR